MSILSAGRSGFCAIITSLEVIKLSYSLLTGGLITVPVGWALLHVFTKDLNTVLDVTMYSLVAFTVAYYTGSMVYPIVDWFLIHIV